MATPLNCFCGSEEEAREERRRGEEEKRRRGEERVGEAQSRAACGESYHHRVLRQTAHDDR